MDSPFNQNLQKTGEYGIATQVSHPIVFIEGLPHVKTHEIILFESGQTGEVFAINRGKIEARIFSHEPILVGTKVTRTNTLLSVPVGKELLGHSISPLGDPIDPTVQMVRPKEVRDIDTQPTGISSRKKITDHLTTGVTLVDLLIPLGRGQRELIIGDRKTGKTSLVLTAIKEQTSKGMIAIYAAIAKKKSDIKKLQAFLEEENVMKNVIIVATSSYDSPSLIHQTPYAAMAIAEYFREKGQDTLLILDDLSTHAKFYRELSLLARRFPGRDSYPGDIFYVHSKLLERAGNFKHPIKGEVAITCLPVVEIVEGDLTGYISTNLMGITDGHMYFDSNIYYEGMRPAINIPLSVTRVGRQTLKKLNREVNKELTAFLSTYDKLLNLSHFGQELTPDVKAALKRGDTVYAFFNQPYQMTVPSTVQLIILSLILQDIITTKEVMINARSILMKAYQKPEIKKWMDGLTNTSKIKEFNDNVLKNKSYLTALFEKAPPKPQTQTPAQTLTQQQAVPASNQPTPQAQPNQNPKATAESEKK